jgi:hypothetical protein
MNSGISPKLRRSSGITSASISDDSTSCFERMSAPKPSAFFPIRRAMILSSPANAPPQMKRTVRRVDREELLVRVLASALWRHRGNGPL